uniref:Uncharacterized protein n=1 Tax=Helianthus annuus TaxID=4232 RepID=A0A251S191_HELAN
MLGVQDGDAKYLETRLKMKKREHEILELGNLKLDPVPWGCNLCQRRHKLAVGEGLRYLAVGWWLWVVMEVRWDMGREVRPRSRVMGWARLVNGFMGVKVG